jgi:hypothetical protein
MNKIAIVSLLVLIGCASTRPQTSLSAVAGPVTYEPQQTDLAALSDEFDDAASKGRWKLVHVTEKLGNQPVKTFEIDQPKGWMTFIPKTSTWYRDYRGALAYKEVTGDFEVTTRIRVRGKAGGAPQSQFSLAGLMIRTPRDLSRTPWRPGGENYIFLSIGSADQPGTWQHEIKTTINSDSQLRTWATNDGSATLRLTRKGASVTAAIDDGGGFRPVQTYNRPDMPRTLQVGICAYTDWPNASQVPPERHNASTTSGGNPDVIAELDYVRFSQPK